MSSLSTMVDGDGISVKYHHQILLEYLSINANSLTFFYLKTSSASTEALCFSWDWTSCCYCSPPLATNGLCSSKAECKTTRRQESKKKYHASQSPGGIVWVNFVGGWHLFIDNQHLLGVLNWNAFSPVCQPLRVIGWVILWLNEMMALLLWQVRWKPRLKDINQASTHLMPTLHEGVRLRITL